MTAPSVPLKARTRLRAGPRADLTRSFHPGIPHCPGFEPEPRVTVYDRAPRPRTRGPGILTHEYRHAGQWGMDVLVTLFEERNIIACGYETTDTDPGFTVSKGAAPLEQSGYPARAFAVCP